jgi:cytochrome P450
MGLATTVAAGAHNLIGDLTPLKSVGLAIGALVAYSWISYFLKSIKIARLGGTAPRRKSWFPGSLDGVYDAIQTSLKHEAMEFWLRGFNTVGHKENPYTIEAYMAGQRLILTADVENIKAILATQFQDFGKGEQFNKDWHEFLGDSIFTTDGQKWHDSRQLIRPQFIKDRLSDINTFEKHCQILVPMLGGISNGQTVDAADLFFRFTLDASTDFLLGKSVDSLHEDTTGFANAFNHAQHIQSMVARAGPLNWIIPRKQFRKDMKLIHKFCDQYIDSALLLSDDELAKTSKSDDGYTFLHALAGFTKDRVVLRDQLIAILLAGRDTTACTLSWLFYELSVAPEKYQKLRREILENVGPDAQPTYENLKSMKYLQVGSLSSQTVIKPLTTNATSHSTA